MKEKAEAEREYNEAISEQNTAFLLEQTKTDVFQIRVGQLKPGSGSKVKLSYVSELPVEGEAVR